MSYSVYIHVNKVNGKKYVGVTTYDPIKRWLSGYQHNKHFNAAIKKYGWKNFDHYIVEVESAEKMYELEKQYISFYQTTNPDKGYNSSRGGESGHNLGKNCYSKEYRKRWYEEHKEQVKEHRKKSYELHKEDRLAKQKINHYLHKEERNKKSMEYHYAHREEIKARLKRYRELHRDELNYKKRAKRKKDTPPITPLW